MKYDELTLINNIITSDKATCRRSPGSSWTNNGRPREITGYLSERDAVTDEMEYKMAITISGWFHKVDLQQD